MAEPLYILVRAYRATGDRILATGDSVIRLESAQAGVALLQLAQARHAIGRLELALPTTNTQVTLRRQDQTLLQTQVPAKMAIIYLPQGSYTLIAQRNRTTHTLPIQLRESIQITVP